VQQRGFPWEFGDVELKVSQLQRNHRWEKTPMWDARKDVEEFRLWGVGLNSDGECFVGRSLTGVAE
jgi:hypothetical protein